jgi:hypothetical protein
MWLRKLSGLLLMLTLANLAVASSDLVCAKHAGGHQAAPESGAPDMDHHAGSDSPETHRCNLPARSDCCAAMISCAPSVSLAAAVTGFDAPTAHVAQPGSTDEVPLTRLIPPDPPPPKV